MVAICDLRHGHIRSFSIHILIVGTKSFDDDDDEALMAMMMGCVCVRVCREKEREKLII